MCGDLFTQLGNDTALTEGDIVGPASAAEDIFKYSSLNPDMGATIRRLSKLAPKTLALMPIITFEKAAPSTSRRLYPDWRRNQQPAANGEKDNTLK